MAQRMAPLALMVLVSACSPSTPPGDAAFAHHDDAALPAFTDAPSLTDAFVASSDAPTSSRTDTGPPGPDARSAEVCTTLGDEDGDRASDCDDSDCWDDCAAVHVARELPGLVACRDVITQTAAQSLAACRSTEIENEVEGDAPTECTEALTLTSTARFFCNAAGAIQAVWLDERLGFPPVETRILSATARELTYYTHSAPRDLARTRSASGSSSTHAVLVLNSGPSTHRIISVFPIASGDTGFQHLLGATRHVDLIMGTTRSNSTRTLLRVGTVNLSTL